MEPAILGLVLDSSVPIAAERRKLRADDVIESIQQSVGEVPIVLCALTIAAVPIDPVTDVTAEIVARAGGEQAGKGANLPLGDLVIGACALELGYAVGTGNLRDFGRIPGLTVIPL